MTRSAPGFVLVNALILIAALSAVAVAMLSDARRGVERLGIAAEAARADATVAAGALLAADLLRRDKASGEIDHAGEGWALDGFPAEADGAVVTVSVVDLAGRFNLNLLTLEEDGRTAAEVFARFAEASGLDPAAARAVVARLETAVPGQGSRTATLTGFLPGEVVHAAQLDAVLDDAALRALAPLVAGLPSAQKINVNTAPPELLAALVTADRDLTPELLALRARTPFEAPQDFARAVEDLAGPGAVVATALVTTGSGWFRVTSDARVGDTRRRVATVLARDPETGDVEVVMQGPAGTE